MYFVGLSPLYPHRYTIRSATDTPITSRACWQPPKPGLQTVGTLPWCKKPRPHVRNHSRENTPPHAVKGAEKPTRFYNALVSRFVPIMVATKKRGATHRVESEDMQAAWLTTALGISYNPMRIVGSLSQLRTPLGQHLPPRSVCQEVSLASTPL